MLFETSQAQANPARELVAAGYLESVTTGTVLALAYPMILGLGRFETAQRLRRSGIRAGLSVCESIGESPPSAFSTHGESTGYS